MSTNFKPGDRVRLKPFEPTIDESDLSPLEPEATIKTDFEIRHGKSTVFSHNESVLLQCTVAIENALMYGSEAVGIEKADPYYTHALAAAGQANRLNTGIREAFANFIPFGTTVAFVPCGAAFVLQTGQEKPVSCGNKTCEWCYVRGPGYGIVCCQSVDGKMGIEKLAEDVK